MPSQGLQKASFCLQEQCLIAGTLLMRARNYRDHTTLWGLQPRANRATNISDKISFLYEFFFQRPWNALWKIFNKSPLEAFRRPLTGLWNALKHMFEAFWRPLAGLRKAFWNPFKGLWHTFWKLFKGPWKAFKKAFNRLLKCPSKTNRISKPIVTRAGWNARMSWWMNHHPFTLGESPLRSLKDVYRGSPSNLRKTSETQII